jgi:hypothetical protein
MNFVFNRLFNFSWKLKRFKFSIERLEASAKLSVRRKTKISPQLVNHVHLARLSRLNALLSAHPAGAIAGIPRRTGLWTNSHKSAHYVCNSHFILA